MKKKYFYKIADLSDDEWSIYLTTEKKCSTLIKKAIVRYYQEMDDCVMEYVKQELDKKDIKFSIIDFEVIDY